MVGGGIHWPPYAIGLALLGWAKDTYSDFNGRLVLNGIRWEKLNSRDLCDVIYAMIIDDVMEMGASRVEAREAIDKRLADIEMRDNVKHGIKPEAEPFKIDPAMMAKLGIKLPAPAKDTT